MAWKAIVVLSCLMAVAAHATDAAKNAGFERMKSLVGEWRGKTQDGGDLAVKYRLVAAGTALEEHLNFADMITMYHVDGKDLMLTHYCAAGNQPRMRAATYKDGDRTIAFAFADATNMPDKNAAHMHNVTFTFLDADHITAEWAHFDAGKESGKVMMSLERLK